MSKFKPINGTVLMKELKVSETGAMGIIIERNKELVGRYEILEINANNDINKGDIVYCRRDKVGKTELEGYGEVYVINEDDIEAVE